MAVSDSTHVTIVKRCRCDADAWDTCRHFWQLAVSKHDERPVFHDVQRALVPFKDLTLPTTRTDFEPFQRYAEAALARCDELDFTVPAARELVVSDINQIWRAGQHLGVVYFIADAEMVKIGWATNLAARVSCLQSGNPRPLTVIASLPGNRQIEDLLHEVFAEYRDHGEWFRLEGRLRRFAIDVACRPVIDRWAVLLQERRHEAPRLSPHRAQ